MNTNFNIQKENDAREYLVYSSLLGGGKWSPTSPTFDVAILNIPIAANVSLLLVCIYERERINANV